MCSFQYKVEFLKPIRAIINRHSSVLIYELEPCLILVFGDLRNVIKAPRPDDFDSGVRHVAQGVLDIVLGNESWKPGSVGSDELEFAAIDYELAAARRHKLRDIGLPFGIPLCPLDCREQSPQKDGRQNPEKLHEEPGRELGRQQGFSARYHDVI